MTLLAFVLIIVMITIFIDYAYYLGYKKGEITLKKMIIFNFIWSVPAIIISIVLIEIAF